jgi:hypothetical protein
MRRPQDERLFHVSWHFPDRLEARREVTHAPWNENMRGASIAHVCFSVDDVDDLVGPEDPGERAGRTVPEPDGETFVRRLAERNGTRDGISHFDPTWRDGLRDEVGS